MARTRQVHWRISPAVYEVLEQMACDTGTSVSQLANYELANALRERLDALAKVKKYVAGIDK